MRTGLILSVVALLAGCGADGDPVPPKADPQPGITMSGSASIGVASR